MKTASAVTTLALLSVAMPVAADCGSGHASASASASTAAPSQLAATPVPAATKAPTSAALKVPASKAAAKQVADKNREAAPDVNVAAVSIR